jgi:hypothetical protein
MVGLQVSGFEIGKIDVPEGRAGASSAITALPYLRHASSLSLPYS